MGIGRAHSLHARQAWPGLITGHSGLVVCPDSRHSEPGPPWDQAWERATTCSFIWLVSQPSLSTYWDRSRAGLLPAPSNHNGYGSVTNLAQGGEG